MISACHTAGVKVIVGQYIVFIFGLYRHFNYYEFMTRHHLQSNVWS